MPVYEIDGLEENTTQIELTKRRIHPSAEDVTTLRAHLSETYAFFLKKSNFEMAVNDEPLGPVEFDSWAYPPDFEPRCYLFEVITDDGGKVGVEINAGLIREKSPAERTTEFISIAMRDLLLKR